MRVSTDLLMHGAEVFRALSPNCSCDLIILKDGKLLRVEVTTGHELLNGRVIHPKKTFAKRDLLAVVLWDGRIEYRPALEAFGFKKAEMIGKFPSKGK